MADRRVLVTGASGFIGSHIVEALLAGGWPVRCLVRERSSRRWLQSLDVEYAIGDVAHDAGLEEACADCTCIVHCAGVTNAVHARTFFEINRDGTRRLRDAAANAGVSRFVYVSSLAARGPRRAVAAASDPARGAAPSAARDDRVRSVAIAHPGTAHTCFPLNAYGQSKLEAEQLLTWRRDAMSTVIVRPPAVYGPRDRDVLTLVRMAFRGFFTMVHGGRQRLSLVHVADLAQGVRLVCERDDARGLHTFTDGHGRTLADFGRAVARAVGRDVRLISMPHAIMWLAAAGGELWGRLSGRAAAINVARLKHFLGADWTVCDQETRAALGYQPCNDLDRGLAETVAWYQRAGWL